MEFLGIALVVGIVVSAIGYTVSAERAGTQMATAFCSVTGGQGCPSGTDGSSVLAGGPTQRCVGAPAGAAGPVRGSVPVAGSGPAGRGLAVSVMGDGTYRVSAAADDPATVTSWVGETFGDTAAGAEPFLLGGGGEVWTASSPGDLATLLSADRRQSWGDAVVGDGESGISRLTQAATGLMGGGAGLPEPTARYTDTGAAAGLSLNAYEQTLALDAGGEAVGTLRYDDGRTTEYVGVRERTTGVAAAPDLVPLLLEIDRDPAGTVLAVRTVTDREFTPLGPTTPSGSLYVTHLDLGTGSAPTAVADLAAAVGSSTLGTAPSATGSTEPPTLASASLGFRDAATAGGLVSRQEPAGRVVVQDPNAEPVQAGLAGVMRSSAPQSWDGTRWTDRPQGCGR